MADAGRFSKTINIVLVTGNFLIDTMSTSGEASEERSPDARNCTKSLVVHTAFDAYFAQVSAPSRTSFNVFSTLVPPLSSEEHATALQSILSSSSQPCSSICSELVHGPLFSRFLRELDEGFNLLFYGWGSKRKLINKFATKCSKEGHVVIAHGFHPNFAIKDLLNSICNIPELSSLPPPPVGIENQARWIYDFFGSPPSKRPLYIVVHNIDAAPFRTTKAKACLSLLALNPCIHLIASVDCISAPLLWSSTELSNRKCGYAPPEQVSPHGFSWLMHDLTTLRPYDVELSRADRSSISGVFGRTRMRHEAGVVFQDGVHMTETAAVHILASVTQKAKKLFVLMGRRQLESAEEGGDLSLGDLKQYAIGSEMLLKIARDNFVVTNDTALRSLLCEFRDHGLVVAAQNSSGSGEALWIPLRTERLSSVLSTIHK